MLGTAAAGGIVMLSVVHWHVRSSFSDFVDDLDRGAMQAAAEVLSEKFDNANGWEALAADPSSVHWALRKLISIRRAAQMAERGRGPGPRRGRPDHPNLMVYDLEGNAIAGRGPKLSEVDLAVAIDRDGQTVGWLGLSRPARFGEPGERQFVDRQRVLFLIGGSVLVILAAIASWILARQLTGPVRQVATGASELAAGRYETRLQRTTQDEVGQLTEDFNRLGRALHRHEGARRRWLAEIAHELRTPLSVLQAELEAIKDGLRRPDTAAIDSLYHEAMHLSRLVNDLHTLSLADAGALNYRFQGVDLAEIIHRAIKSYQTAFDQKGIELKLDSESETKAKTSADPQRIEQLMTNLLRNSLLYTDQGGRVQISLQARQGDWEIIVADSEPGVADQDLPVLFDAFHRCANDQTQGSGLGLAICERIVAAHGGEITADHSPLGGLQVSIRLPSS